jgi:hypothetical protein
VVTMFPTVPLLRKEAVPSLALAMVARLAAGMVTSPSTQPPPVQKSFMLSEIGGIGGATGVILDPSNADALTDYTLIVIIHLLPSNSRCLFQRLLLLNRVLRLVTRMHPLTLDSGMEMNAVSNALLL